MIRGATYELEIAVKKADGTALDLTLATEILVGLYSDGRRVFGKYSLTNRTADGFGSLTRQAGTGGLVTVYIEADETLSALEKVAKCEVVVTFANANYENSEQICIATDITIEAVNASIFEGVI